MPTLVSGSHLGDRVDHFHTFRNPAEYCVAPALHRFAGEVEKIVIGMIDEKL